MPFPAGMASFDCELRVDRKLLERSRSFLKYNRHFCEGRNPENSIPGELDARLRKHDE